MLSDRSERHRKIVAWLLLALVFAAGLYAIDAIIPHPYASRGLAIFVGVAVPVAMFLRQWRWRRHAIGALGGVIAAGVVSLHLVATNTITIENRSGQRVEGLIVLSSQERIGFSLAGLRSGQRVKVRFQDLQFTGHLHLSGELADGTRFPDIRYQPFAGTLLGGSGRTRHVRLLIGPAGHVEVRPAGP